MTQTDSSATPFSDKAFKRAGSIRAGFAYQDFMGLKELIDFYQSPDLYEWVRIESDGPADEIDPGFLDDIFCKKKTDNRVIVKQVKFCVDPTKANFALSFDWLLDKKGGGTSLLFKWSSSVEKLLTQNILGDACLLTNRIPDQEVINALDGEHIDPTHLSEERWNRICEEIGSKESTLSFLKNFRFAHSQKTLKSLEWDLKARLVPDYTDDGGWFSLVHEVKKWAMFKNEPPPDGNITHEVLQSVLSTRRPKPLSQEFYVPEGYQPPDNAFDQEFRKKLYTPGLFVLWGTPGRGKSTYLSNLVHQLRQDDVTVIRHHYFLSLADASGDRVSFIDIAFSLMDQMRTYCAEAIIGLSSRADDLRSCLVKCGQWSKAKEGKPFVVVIDGLDHVWRERGSNGADQMNHLFSAILPLPNNITLVLGTQKVSDEQLPLSLLNHSDREQDWIELPSMSVATIRFWIEYQAKDGRLIAPDWAQDEDQRSRWLIKIADAFQKITGGHPLHLIYSIENLVHRRRSVIEDDILALPTCPDGDIRSYYDTLWRSLTPKSKEILHLIATSGFNWPPEGIFYCLGNTSDIVEGWQKIEHLLEIRRTAVLPFHGSILVYVKERPDHQIASLGLIPKAVNWLEINAPDYWRWAWLWLTKAKAGEPENLLNGPSRKWMNESLCKGYPNDQIHQIIVGSERAALDAEAYPRLVELRALEIRLLNGFDYQTYRHADFLECVLKLSDDTDLIDIWFDNLRKLNGEELVLISRFAASKGEADVLKNALKQANDQLRYESEFGKHNRNELLRYGETVAQIGAMAVPSANRIIKFAHRWQGGKLRIFSAYINELCKVDQVENLFEIWNLSELPPEFLQVLAKACVQEACKHKISLEKRPEAGKILCFPLGAVWHYVATGKSVSKLTAQLTSSPSKGEVFRAEESAVHIWHYFFADVANILFAKGDFELIPYPKTESTPDWLVQALAWLQIQARRIADRIKSGQTLDITSIFKGSSSLAPLQKGADYDVSSAYDRFCQEVCNIASDIHMLAMSQGQAEPVSHEQLEAICIAPFWNYWNWFHKFKDLNELLLSQETALFLIKILRNDVKSKLSEMNMRGDDYLDLAQFAVRYKLHDQAHELLKKAADCITGYGHRKDIAVFDILEAVETCADAGVGDIHSWLTRLVPAIEAIEGYTDGKGTRHALKQFIEIIGKYKPELLSSLYRKQVEAEEWYDADTTLAETIKRIDLSEEEAQALVKTLENPQALEALHVRAKAGAIDASRLLNDRKRMLGIPIPASDKEKSGATLREGGVKNKAVHVKPADFPPSDLKKLIKKIRGNYEGGERILQEWFDYWVEQGHGIEVIQIIDEIIETDRPYEVDYLLDNVFEAALKLQGKRAAYPWLVRAHVQLSGWHRYSFGKTSCLNRLRRVAETYPDQWRKYVRDVSEPRWKVSSDGSVVIGRDLLVRLLLLVGERQLAADITGVMISTFLSELADQPIGGAPWQS